MQNNKEKMESVRFSNECLTFCEIHGIHPLSTHILRTRCLRIPDSGIEAIHKPTNLKNKFYPIISSKIFDGTAEKKLGRYATNNGVIVFVHCDGDTYLTKDWSVFTELANNGYKRGNLPVALSCEETISDPVLCEKWENLSPHLSTI